MISKNRKQKKREQKLRLVPSCGIVLLFVDIFLLLEREFTLLVMKILANQLFFISK
jgi:hypothetical protein